MILISQVTRPSFCSLDIQWRCVISNLVAFVANCALGMGMVRSARLARQAIRLVTTSTQAQHSDRMVVTPEAANSGRVVGHPASSKSMLYTQPLCCWAITRVQPE